MYLTLATSIAALAVLAAAAPQPAGQRTGIAIPITKRSTFMNADKSINPDTLKSHVAAVKAKIHRGFANYEKNTGRKHPSDVGGVERRGAGIPLVDGHAVWYGSISVGTPAKPFTVFLDTGSTDLHLPGSACDSGCNNRDMWDPSASSTSHDLGQSFKVTYGDGTALSGEEYTDTVSIAGFSATNQTLGAAKEISGVEIYLPSDGLMGMAFESISSFSTSSVFQTLVNQGSISDPVFSIKFSLPGAELYIGGSNPDLYTGEFAYTNVTHKGFWQVIMDGVEANGETILTDVHAIIDTGTTLMAGSSSDISTLYNALGGKPAPSVGEGHYTLPCNSFPPISLTFGCKSFEIAGLNRGPVSDGSSDCLSSLAGGDIENWVIGDVFLQGVYTTFDMDNDNARVGFADLA